jgi:hypothetical protein
MSNTLQAQSNPNLVRKISEELVRGYAGRQPEAIVVGIVPVATPVKIAGGNVPEAHRQIKMGVRDCGARQFSFP